MCANERGEHPGGSRARMMMDPGTGATVSFSSAHSGGRLPATPKCQPRRMADPTKKCSVRGIIDLKRLERRDQRCPDRLVHVSEGQ